MAAPTAQERAAAGAIAALVLSVLAVRFALTMETDGTAFGQAFWKLYRFFTLWTVTLVGVACGLIALGHTIAGFWRGGLLLAICIVGLVYHILLAWQFDHSGAEWLVDQALHTVVPLVFAGFWVAFGSKRVLTYVHPLIWLLYPLVYCVYALVRAASDGVYPYSFLDLPKLGYEALVLNIAGLSLGFFLGGLLIVKIAHWLDQ